MWRGVLRWLCYHTCGVRNCCSEDRGFLGGKGDGESLALVVEGKRTIHAFMDLYPGPGVACPVLRRQYLEAVSLKLHHVVASHGAVVLEAEDSGQIQVRGDRLIGTLGLSRWDHESAVVAGQEPSQYVLRLFQCPRVGQP